MFLTMLNEKERKNFLELAYIAMHLGDGDTKLEAAVVNSFKHEMELDDYEPVKKTLEDLVMAFNSSKKMAKRVVIIELAGVLDADDIIDKVEDEWIKNLGKNLGMREAEVKKLIAWTQEFNDFLKEGYSMVEKRG